MMFLLQPQSVCPANIQILRVLKSVCLQAVWVFCIFMPVHLLSFNGSDLRYSLFMHLLRCCVSGPDVFIVLLVLL